jgi:hypothetical protein
MTTRAALLWIILVLGAICTSAPAIAQTYDPNYPVCLQIYSPSGGYISCRYTSIAQCNVTASGRGARCYANPYYVLRGRPARRH